MKIKKLSLLLAISLLIVVAFFVYKALQPSKSVYGTTDVVKGDILQEISETGSITKGEAVGLNFKNAGTIQAINVSVGQMVVLGEALAQLETGNLMLRLAQAKANMELAIIKLNRLLNGATAQDLKIAQSRVANARVAFQNAEQNLTDVQRTANERLLNVYDDATDVLTDVYTKAYNAQNFASWLQRAYFTTQGQDGIKVYENNQTIKTASDQIKLAADSAVGSNDRSIRDRVLKTVSGNLEVISKSLRDIREICEKPQWRDAVSETDKAALDTQRSLVNSSLAALTSASQAITSQLVANDYSINTAQAALKATESQLQFSQDEYDSIVAPPRDEDVALLNNQVGQSKAEYELLLNDVNNAVLKSPVNGEVIAVNKRTGEIAQQMAVEPAIVVLPTDPFKIDVDIYEEDVVKIKIGDVVSIALTAFPDKNFTGTVISIDPAEKLVNGVVYYPTKISFDSAPAGLKPGMSADVAIKTVLGENVVKIPESALQKRNATYFAQVLENGNPVEKAVIVGVRSKTEIEILSGLVPGEKVILP